MAKQAAPVTRPAKSAKPGTEDGAAQKEKVERIDYVVPEGGLTEVPADFDPKKHKPLKRKDFKDESVFLLSRAAELEKKAAWYRTEAENVKKLGSVKDRVKAKRLLAMQKRMQELQASLAAEGVDVAALLGTLEATAAE